MKLLGAGKGIEGLKRCLFAKYTLERFEFEAETEEGGFGLIMIITECPWHELIVKSGRAGLSERVGFHHLQCRVQHMGFGVWQGWRSEYVFQLRIADLQRGWSLRLSV